MLSSFLCNKYPVEFSKNSQPYRGEEEKDNVVQITPLMCEKSNKENTEESTDVSCTEDLQPITSTSSSSSKDSTFDPIHDSILIGLDQTESSPVNTTETTVSSDTVATSSFNTPDEVEIKDSSEIPETEPKYILIPNPKLNTSSKRSRRNRRRRGGKRILMKNSKNMDDFNINLYKENYRKGVIISGVSGLIAGSMGTFYGLYKMSSGN